MIKQLCKNQKGCPGCQLKNLPLEKQLSYKMRLVIKLMGRFCHVDEIIPSPEAYYYRSSVRYICTFRGGKPFWGMYSRADGKAVRHGGCLIEDKDASAAADAACAAAAQAGVSFYDGRRGALRHVAVRKGSGTGELMVLLVTTPKISERDMTALRLAAEKTAERSDVKTVVRCVNGTTTPIFISETAETLVGDGYIDEIICGSHFRLMPMSFRQVNSAAAELLYSTAAQLVREGGDISKMTVLDAYCGTGVMGLCAAAQAGHLVGADTVASSVEDARAAAASRGVDAEYFTADAAEVLERMADRGAPPQCVIADPPRAGLSRRFLSALSSSDAERIVYVSCDPEALARDTAVLCRRGYRVKRVQPIDMFPHTDHVECVVLLTK
jgi:23S rRNA (uracil1939-C5)-methyltransferase